MAYGAVMGQVVSSSEKIGDVKITARTDLGDKWLLCNGDIIYPNEYPALYALLNSQQSITNINNWESITLGTSTNVLPYPQINAIAYGGNQWVAVDSRGNAYISSDGLNWTQATVAQTSGGEYTNLTDIAYYNGTWVAVGVNSSVATRVGVYVSQQPSSNWNAIGGQNIQRGSHAPCISVYNGTWVIGAGGLSPSTGCIAYTTNPSGTWTINSGTASLPDSPSVLDIACYNGTWAALLSTGDIITTTNPGGTWKTITSPLSSLPSMTGAVLKNFNGRWVITRSSTNILYIYSSTSVNGPWTTYSISGNSSTASGDRINDIYFDGNYYVVTSGDDYIWINDSLSSSGWEKITSTSSTNPSTYCVFANNGTWVVGGGTPTSTSTSSSQRKSMLWSYSTFLPNISLNHTYAYIKAQN